MSSPRLRSVIELYGRHPGSDIYLVGTGPSMRVFPADFLAGRLTIGLNMAWKLAPVTYGITIHPELNIPEFIAGCEPRPEITWITKRGKLSPLTKEQIRHAEDRYYFFRNEGRANTQTNGQSDAGRFPEWVDQPYEDYLYLWSSISSTAANLAAHMGAKNIYLVGCDNAAILGNHHAHSQHTLWMGADPDQRYHDYYEALSEVRSALRRRGVNLISLNPFLTLGPHEEDFARLCAELDRPEFVPNEDITHSHRSAGITHPPPAARRSLLGKGWQRVVSESRRRL